jgi:hypothetical protein
MSAAPKYIICISAGVLAEAAVFLAAMMVTFTGCGSAPLPDGFAFVTPYYMMVPQKSLPVSIALVFFVITLLQMPIYGWILGHGWVHHRFRKRFLILAVVHIIAGFVGYWIYTRMG